jgi:hypothetical protein
MAIEQAYQVVLTHNKEENIIENIFLLQKGWWYTLVISALRKVRQEDHELKASLGYIVGLRSTWTK